MSLNGHSQTSEPIRSDTDGRYRSIMKSGRSSLFGKARSVSHSSTEPRSTKPALIKLQRCLGLAKSTPWQVSIEVTSHDGTYWIASLSDTQSAMPTLLDLLESISRSNTTASPYERVSLLLTLPRQSLSHIFSVPDSPVLQPISSRPGCIRITVERTDTI